MPLVRVTGFYNAARALLVLGPGDFRSGLDPSILVFLKSKLRSVGEKGRRKEVIVPARKRTMAFKQANSAGSTWTALNLIKVSARTLMSEEDWPIFVCSFGLNKELDVASKGMHHWMALRRNSSLQASSKRITFRMKRLIDFDSKGIKAYLVSKW